MAPDGTKRQLFGPNPKGILVLAANGHYAQIIVHPDRPNFKVNNRLEGTPEENAAAVHGTTATFGTWSVDEASTTLIVRNEGGMFPNQVGTDPNAPSPWQGINLGSATQTRPLAGDQLQDRQPKPGLWRQIRIGVEAGRNSRQ